MINKDKVLLTAEETSKVLKKGAMLGIEPVRAVAAEAIKKSTDAVREMLGAVQEQFIIKEEIVGSGARRFRMHRDYNYDGHDIHEEAM